MTPKKRKGKALKGKSKLGRKVTEYTLVKERTEREIINQIQPTLDKIDRVREILNEVFVERKEVIDIILYALILRRHVLLYGPPGTAKSDLGLTAFSAIQGSSVFSVQVAEDTRRDDIFGPMSMREYRENDRIVYTGEDMIQDAHFAFLDEFFDGPSFLLRTMLRILNERKVSFAGEERDCPLRTAILTANYISNETVLDAVKDRILFKVEVKKISDSRNRKKMYRNFLARHGETGNSILEDLAQVKLTLEELDVLYNLILSREIRISKTLIEVFERSLIGYQKETNQTITDRRANQLLLIVKATALLRGRTKVLAEDMPSTVYGACVVGDKKRHDLVWEQVIGKEIEAISTIESVETSLQYMRNQLNEIDLASIETEDDKLLMELRALQDIDRRATTLDIPSDLANSVDYKKTLDGIIEECREKIRSARATLDLG